MPYAVENVREVLGKKPVFGICMGHQLLGQVITLPVTSPGCGACPSKSPNAVVILTPLKTSNAVVIPTPDVAGCRPLAARPSS